MENKYSPQLRKKILEWDVEYWEIHVDNLIEAKEKGEDVEEELEKYKSQLNISKNRYHHFVKSNAEDLL